MVGTWWYDKKQPQCRWRLLNMVLLLISLAMQLPNTLFPCVVSKSYSSLNFSSITIYSSPFTIVLQSFFDSITSTYRFWKLGLFFEFLMFLSFIILSNTFIKVFRGHWLPFFSSRLPSYTLLVILEFIHMTFILLSCLLIHNYKSLSFDNAWTNIFDSWPHATDNLSFRNHSMFNFSVNSWVICK